MTLSNLPDDYIMVRQTPDRVRKVPDKSHWMVDSLVKKCMGTGKKFGFFTRKHHCRLTGNIYCDEVCKNYAPLPDLGWYKPERIHNGALGFGATEMREDVVLRLQRKSEFAAVLFKAKGKGRFDARRFGNFVTVSSSFRPRVAPVDSLIRTSISSARACVCVCVCCVHVTLTHSLTHPLPHPLTHSLTHSHTHSHTHSLTHPTHTHTQLRCKVRSALKEVPEIWN